MTISAALAAAELVSCCNSMPGARAASSAETRAQITNRIPNSNNDQFSLLFFCFRRQAHLQNASREIVGQAWGGKYRGQTQKWYALRFTGDENEINIASPAGGHDPEFVEWRWEPLANLPAMIVPFKRPVYERVVQAFAKFASPSRAG